MKVVLSGNWQTPGTDSVFPITPMQGFLHHPHRKITRLASKSLSRVFMKGSCGVGGSNNTCAREGCTKKEQEKYGLLANELIFRVTEKLAEPGGQLGWTLLYPP